MSERLEGFIERLRAAATDETLDDRTLNSIISPLEWDFMTKANEARDTKAYNAWRAEHGYYLNRFLDEWWESKLTVAKVKAVLDEHDEKLMEAIYNQPSAQ